jgi:sec-independent protein translocase protein TatB
VALIVIGPKDLPKVMRVMGQWTRKARLLASEFQNNFDELLRQAELDEVRRQVEQVNPGSLKDKVETMIDAKAIEAALVVDPPGTASAAPAPAEAQAQAPLPSSPAEPVSVPEPAAAEPAPASEPAAAVGEAPAAAVSPAVATLSPVAAAETPVAQKSSEPQL